MTIIIGKLIRKTFTHSNGSFHLYQLRVSGGKYTSAVYKKEDAPKALKTCEYQLHGRWERTERFGEQFIIESYARYSPPDEKSELEILQNARKFI